MRRFEKILSLFLIVLLFLVPSSFGMFTQPDRTLPNIYDPQQLNRYAYAQNNPYNYVDPDGKAAVWIHYTDTFKNYFLATGDPFLAADVAAGAVEPDLYRSAEAGGFTGTLAKGASYALFLDRQMDVMGPDSHYYYHFAQGPGGKGTVDLMSAYKQALSKGDTQRMGNLEHGLGHDVGSNGIAGYHQFEIEQGHNAYDPVSHGLNDVLSTRTDRAALNQAQYERAKSARPLGLPSRISTGVKNAINKVKSWFKK